MAPTLTPRRVLALYVSFSSLQKGQLSFSLLVGLPRRQCATSLQTQCVRWQRSLHSGPTCSSSICPVPVPLGAAAHPSRAGCWPPSLLGPSRSSCWWLLVQQGEPAGQRGLGAPWCWPGEQLSLAAQMGVLAQGPTADSSPGASPSHRPASALLATQRCWYCRHRPPRVPVPPAPGSGTTGVWREGWDLGGSGSTREKTQPGGFRGQWPPLGGPVRGRELGLLTVLCGSEFFLKPAGATNPPQTFLYHGNFQCSS